MNERERYLYVYYGRFAYAGSNRNYCCRLFLLFNLLYTTGDYIPVAMEKKKVITATEYFYFYVPYAFHFVPFVINLINFG